jgi:uncharacterized protein (DUF433 family)
MDWNKYITVDPEIHHGEPYIKGTRIPVSVIARSIADGMTHDEIIEAYPQLTQESIHAAMSYESNRVWDRLVKIGEELDKGWHSDKSAVEILSEMRR